MRLNGRIDGRDPRRTLTRHVDRTVRERLWVLMGLDNLVDEREPQIVDNDADTGEWGLTDQIARSERRRIPTDPELLLQRIEDEQVRQARARGCDRRTVAEVFGVSLRAIFYKENRAQAYDFSLDALDRRGGRPPSRGAGGDRLTSGISGEDAFCDD